MKTTPRMWPSKFDPPHPALFHLVPFAVPFVGASEFLMDVALWGVFDGQE